MRSSKFIVESTHIISGKIQDEGEFGDAIDVVMVGDKPLAHIFAELFLIDAYLSVRFFISDKKKSIEEAQDDFTLNFLGHYTGKYQDCYSDYTGHLWTDEELNIGGHDLLHDISIYDGKHLNMEIRKFKKVR